MGDRYYRDRDSGFGAGVIGAILGAAATAFFFFLSKRENRDKVRNKLNELKKEGLEKVDELKEKSPDAQNEAKSNPKGLKEENEKDKSR